MSVSVRVPTILRTYTGGESEVSASGTTLAEVLDDLDANYTGIKARVLDDEGNLRRFVNVYVGNDDVRFLDNLATPDPRRHPDLGDPSRRRRLLSRPSRTCNTLLTDLPRPPQRCSTSFAVIELRDSPGELVRWLSLPLLLRHRLRPVGGLRRHRRGHTGAVPAAATRDDVRRRLLRALRHLGLPRPRSSTGRPRGGCSACSRCPLVHPARRDPGADPRTRERAAPERAVRRRGARPDGPRA